MVNGKRNYIEWSKEELIREILALKKQKTYGLVWEREKTKEDFDLFINWEGEKTKEEFSPESKDKFPVLAEVKDKEINSDKDKPVNLLIEGDNYHSLAVLNFTHKNSVDVIYIDPPYNTGNKDFKYNDKFVDKEDGYRHSKWLSFMSKRLALAKNLLKDTGIIFISIDDNENAQLKLLCEDIFGETNFVANFVWKRRSGANDPKNLVSTDHEYIFCYKKSEKASLFGIEKDLSNYKNPNNDPRGPWTAGDLTCGKTKDERPNLYYDITDPKTGKVYPANPSRVWRFERVRMLNEIKAGKVIFPKKENGTPQYKRFANELKSNFKPLSTWIEASVIKKVAIDSEEDENGIKIMQSDLNQAATKELRNIFGKQLFNYPKPKKLLKELIKYSCPEKGVVLDFMAGSGTTGHAVMELNDELNQDLSFILCTNNEGNICSDVCYPRIQKIIKGYTNASNEKIEGLGGNLKYYKTDFVEAEQTDKNKRKLVDNCTEMLCIKENTFEKVKDTKKFKIFKNDKLHLGIVFDDEYIDEFVKEAEKINGKIHVYVFSHDDSVPTKEFKTIKNKVTLCPIPETILKVYRKVFKND
ncbi:site-specific DNA-methyltransferase [archaeon]|nr:site-specific DNA-methyltransferase [Nanoarchaeota archaeon]MCG2724157.1 site-specific DNA-methyltransferase [archaeon]